MGCGLWHWISGACRLFFYVQYFNPAFHLFPHLYSNVFRSESPTHVHPVVLLLYQVCLYFFRYPIVLAPRNKMVIQQMYICMNIKTLQFEVLILAMMLLYTTSSKEITCIRVGQKNIISVLISVVVIDETLNFLVFPKLNLQRLLFRY